MYNYRLIADLSFKFNVWPEFEFNFLNIQFQYFLNFRLFMPFLIVFLISFYYFRMDITILSILNCFNTLNKQFSNF